MPHVLGVLSGDPPSPPAPRGRCGHSRRTSGRRGAEPVPQPRRLGDCKPGRRALAAGRVRPPGQAMQTLEVGLVPAPAREPRLTRWLRRGSVILAHLVALGFTIFLTLLSRPGTSECARQGGAREGGGAEVLEGQRLEAWSGGPGRGVTDP